MFIQASTSIYMQIHASVNTESAIITWACLHASVSHCTEALINEFATSGCRVSQLEIAENIQCVASSTALGLLTCSTCMYIYMHAHVKSSGKPEHCDNLQICHIYM